jgi:undecaprenyl-diphosphatase
MTFLSIVLMSLIQGLTEFLPISSSAHLVFTEEFLGISSPGISFHVFAHLGSLLAIVVFFRRGLIKLFQGLKRHEEVSWRILGLLFLASLPIAGVGFFFAHRIEKTFESVLLAGFFLLITGSTLFLTRGLKSGNKKLNEVTLRDAFIIGLSQASSCLPGISRSGVTLTASLFRGLKKEDAFKFSFLLAIPAIFGAVLLESFKLEYSNVLLCQLFLITILSAGVSYLALKYLAKIVRKGSLHFFSYYCWVIGGLAIILNFIR